MIIYMRFNTNHLNTFFMRKSLFYCLLALLAFTACSEEFEGNNPNRTGDEEFNPNVAFLRLQDDSTDVAGMLDITTRSSSVELKWAVSPECNLDTTVTPIKLSDGKYRLPIKWLKKQNEGTYGPAYTVFSAGVQIMDGGQNKYVPLLWADEIDESKVMESIEEMKISTRSTDGKPRAGAVINILGDLPIQLDKDTCGVIPFSFDGASAAYIDFSDFEEINDQEGYNMELDDLDTYYTDKEDSKIDLKWTADGAPDADFVGHIRIYLPVGIAKYAYFAYNRPKVKEWEYIETKPDTLSTLPATGASIIAIAKTNYPWSLRFMKEDGATDTIYSVKGAEGEQSLLMRIPDNMDVFQKNIIVDVYSQDTLKVKLKFTQSAASGSFVVDSLNPPVTEELSGNGQRVNVNVTTSREWWVEFDGDRRKYGINDKVGYIDIPQNPLAANRFVNVIVGYDNTIAGTYKYTQTFADELEYVTSTMPDSLAVAGGTYTFTFRGAYQGTLQLKAMVGSEVIVVGASSINKELSLTIPSNSGSLDVRQIEIQYKKGTGDWIESLEVRPQKAAIIIPSVLPSTDIPREGGSYAGLFGGTYTGIVYMEVREGTTVIDQAQNSAPGSVSLAIPALTSPNDRLLTFYYKVADKDWISMGSRTQVAGTVSVGTITPSGNIPANGGTYSCLFTGTYPDDITFRAADKDGNTLAAQTGKMPFTFSISVPANENKDARDVIFQYQKKNGDWVTIETRKQTSDIKINGGGNHVGDFDDEEIITGGGEL